jgi:hypothetical protein
LEKMTATDVQTRVQVAIDRLVESGTERGLQVAVYRCVFRDFWTCAYQAIDD